MTALPEHLQPARFLCYWTLKEAYAKARGLGLALPLDELSFDLSGEGIEIAVGPSVDDEGADWQFDQWAPTDHHVVAVALRSGPSGGTRVVRHSKIPAWKSTEERA